MVSGSSKGNLTQSQLDFDDYRAVHTALRNLNPPTSSARKAIKIIAKKTELTEERVKEIIIKIVKEKE